MLLRRLPVRRVLALPHPRWNSGGPGKPTPMMPAEPSKENEPVQAVVDEYEQELAEAMERVQQSQKEQEEMLQKLIREAVEDSGITQDDLLTVPKAWKELNKSDQSAKPVETNKEKVNSRLKVRREPPLPQRPELSAMETEALAAHFPLSLEDLPKKPTEEQYAAALVHGRSWHKPFRHEQTHNVPVAIVQFRSYHTRLLELFTHFASHAAASLGIPISGIVMLPNKRKLWTVPKSPFIYKSSQENFERIEHKRAIKAWDADEAVVLRWIKYLERHNMAGVGMRIVRWERVGFGLEGLVAPKKKPSKALLTDKGGEIKLMSQKIVKAELGN